MRLLENFVTRHNLRDIVKNGDNLIILFHDDLEKLVYFHQLDEKKGLYFKDIIQSVSDIVYWNLEFTTVYVGTIIGDSFAIKMSFNSDFLSETILQPDKRLIFKEDYDDPEIRSYVMNRINELLTSGDVDFVTINMLTKYFMIDRSNLNRFRNNKTRSLGMARSVFVLNFLNRVVIDLTWGEIKKLILLNCERDDILRKALKMNNVEVPLSKFYRIITTRHDISLSIAVLKNVLATYMYLADGQEPKTRKSYEYKHKLNPDEEHSFTYNI